MKVPSRGTEVLMITVFCVFFSTRIMFVLLWLIIKSSCDSFLDCDHLNHCFGLLISITQTSVRQIVAILVIAIFSEFMMNSVNIESYLK